jgi:hypothetical protein
MTKSGAKRMIVLRDIPSNLIEEAILILKNDNNVKENGLIDKNQSEEKKDFLILREAEMIINSFNKQNVVISRNPNVQEILTKKWYIDIIINTCLICGIGILIFLIIKAF